MKTQDILQACKTFGVKLEALSGGKIAYYGEPPAALSRVIKLRKAELWEALPPPKMPEKNASMLAWLRDRATSPEIVVYKGERFDVGDEAKRLLKVPQDDAWWHDSGKLWLAVNDADEWYADSDSYLTCDGMR